MSNSRALQAPRGSVNSLLRALSALYTHIAVFMNTCQVFSESLSCHPHRARCHESLTPLCVSLTPMLLQAVAAFIRPHPHSALRGAWNAVHHNLGRLLILLVGAVGVRGVLRVAALSHPSVFVPLPASVRFVFGNASGSCVHTTAVLRRRTRVLAYDKTTLYLALPVEQRRCCMHTCGDTDQYCVLCCGVYVGLGDHLAGCGGWCWRGAAWQQSAVGGARSR